MSDLPSTNAHQIQLHVDNQPYEDKLEEMADTLDLAKNEEIGQIKAGNNDSINMRDDGTVEATHDRTGDIAKYRHSALDRVEEEDDNEAHRAYCQSELELLQRINDKLRDKVKRQNEAIDTKLAHQALDKSLDILQDTSYMSIEE